MITCIFEDGRKTSLRHVTVTVLVIKDGKILLGKRGTYKGKPMLEFGKWGPLGGFLDRDETLEEAAKREVMEESGWTIEDLMLFRINDNPNRPKEDRQNMDVIFIARATQRIGKPDEEITNLKWFDLNDLPPLDEIAFDHAENINFYKHYLKNKFILPIVGRSIF